MKTHAMLLALLLPLVACGSGTAPPANCADAARRWQAIVDMPQPCTVDTDCRDGFQGCFGGAPLCTSVALTQANAAAAHAIVQQATTACGCAECSAPNTPIVCKAGQCHAVLPSEIDMASPVDGGPHD